MMITGDEIVAVKTVFDCIRSALSLVRDLKPRAGKADPAALAKADTAIAKAEQAARLAEAHIAGLLGYKLCRCVFPPVAMLKVGTRNDPSAGHGIEVSRCPLCRFTDHEHEIYDDLHGRTGFYLHRSGLPGGHRATASVSTRDRKSAMPRRTFCSGVSGMVRTEPRE